MELVETIHGMKSLQQKWGMADQSIGFVPTMGYLHEGHRQLITESVKNNQRTVVSIFVNPTQFGPKEDLSHYPRDFERDMELCRTLNVDAIFYPSVEEMYPQGFSTTVNLSELTSNLCGASRPTHFAGVCTVVTKLLLIIGPTRAYFGEKDYQQLQIIRQLVEDLTIPVTVIGCPIVRESDGLAMSSRNSYLNAEQRKSAKLIYQSITKGKELWKQERNPDKVIESLTETIRKEPLARIDYIEILDAKSLQKMSDKTTNILIAAAVFIGEVRLIDNVTILNNSDS